MTHHNVLFTYINIVVVVYISKINVYIHIHDYNSVVQVYISILCRYINKDIEFELVSVWMGRFIHVFII